jgi:hypothetical protein
MSRGGCREPSEELLEFEILHAIPPWTRWIPAPADFPADARDVTIGKRPDQPIPASPLPGTERKASP